MNQIQQPKQTESKSLSRQDQRRWSLELTAALAGFLFASGLALSGMTQPSKVIGFLDFAGNWDATLVFVMGGAVMVYATGFRLIRWRKKKPVFGTSFEIPTRKTIDAKLVGGAALFGIGWGLAGFCPGPALAGTGALRTEAMIFYVFMTLGMMAYGKFFRRRG